MTGFVTTAQALTRYQKGRDIDPASRELVGDRPMDWIKAVPESQAILEIATDSVMEHLNSGYLQHGLFAIAFGGL